MECSGTGTTSVRDKSLGLWEYGCDSVSFNSRRRLAKMHAGARLRLDSNQWRENGSRESVMMGFYFLKRDREEEGSSR